MNDIADKIWAAIQRPSPPVTKDEIIALVNEGRRAVPYGMTPARVDLTNSEIIEHACARLATCDHAWAESPDGQCRRCNQCGVVQFKSLDRVIGREVSDGLYEQKALRLAQQLVPDAPAGISGGIYGMSPAEVPKQITALMAEVDRHLDKICTNFAASPDINGTIVEKVWFDGEAVQRLPIEPADWYRVYGSEGA